MTSKTIKSQDSRSGIYHLVSRVREGRGLRWLSSRVHLGGFLLLALCQVDDSVSLGRMVYIGWGSCVSKVPHLVDLCVCVKNNHLVDLCRW